jgi:hypothetical protein
MNDEPMTMLDSERDRIFGDWLAGHKGILFKVVHAYAFEHADRQDLFQEIVIQVWRSGAIEELLAGLKHSTACDQERGDPVWTAVRRCFPPGVGPLPTA